ncbi:hypothetical protein [Streptomyces sp. NPDC018693]|uniref:hypothetical protein n=1 Tax=unclassified Streptomyces TaxID=2593676 RepID=UPI0037AB79F5
MRTLQQELESGTWTPSAPERTAAAVILTAHPHTARADAILDALRTAGPGIAPTGGTEFSALLVQSASLLRSHRFAISTDGHRLWTGLLNLVSAIVKSTSPPSWGSRLFGRLLAK